MTHLACCLLFDNKWYSSGIIFDLEDGLAFTILPEKVCHSSYNTTVWFRFYESVDGKSIVEFPANILKCLPIASNKLIKYILFPMIVLVQLKSKIYFSKIFKPLTFNNFSYCPILQGDKVVVVGSPFGPVCPPVLLNNFYSGIVSKTFGHNVSFLLIDTFCPPGLIGAPVFIFKQEKLFLYGLLLSDSRISNNFGTISPVLSLMHIVIQFQNMSCISPFKLFVSMSQLTPIIFPSAFSSISSVVSPEIFNKLVIVNTGNNNGSGYMLTNGICITCAHVVGSKKIGGAVYISSVNHSPVLYKIAFSTIPNVYPDIAILTEAEECNFEDILNDEITNINVNNTLCKGIEIFGISYGSSDFSEHSQLPLLTNGIVSNVVKINELVLFGQASCSLSPGSSGGLLIERHSYRILGLLSGFAKSLKNGVTNYYPRVSRFIPFQIIFLSLKYGIIKTCNNFENDNYIQDLWNYRDIVLHPSKL